MVNFDFIIVSNSMTDEFFQMTKNCIDSIYDTANLYMPTVIVVEQNKNVTHDKAITVHYDFEFNYNKCLNLGLKYSASKYKALCNNDLIFQENWCQDILAGFKMGFGSLSSYCLNSHKKKFPIGNHIISGLRVEYELAGWCFFITDETLKSIGKLDEGVVFWYSDNIYAEQLSLKGIKHGLVCSSFVTHIESQTLARIHGVKKKELTTAQQKNFYERRNMILMEKVKNKIY